MSDYVETTSTQGAPVSTSPSGQSPQVVLSKIAPWADPKHPASHRLHNSYRDRFTEVEGRKFKVSATSMNSLWDIEEIDANGETLVRAWTKDEHGLPVPVLGYVDFAFTLNEARQKIAYEVRGSTQDG